MKCKIYGTELDGDPKVSSITGKLDGKTVTMCFPCFHKNFKLEKPAPTNIFLRRTTT